MSNKKNERVNLFANNECPVCKTKYDYTKLSCPKCHHKLNDEKVEREWRDLTPLGYGKEIGCFLTGLLGLKVIGATVSYIASASAKDYVTRTYSTVNEQKEALHNILRSGVYGGVVNYTAYFILFVIFLLVLWGDNKRILKKFTQGKTYIGFAMGLALMACNMVYGIIISHTGITSSNANQDAVNNATTFLPIVALIIFGLVGPFCEEVTYRLGLFNLTKRANKALAYILTPLVFGLIHFGWVAAFNFSSPEATQAAIIEWANLPSYIIAGLLLCVTYDKFGFGASFLAHATNNFLGILFSIIASQAH